MDGFQPRIENPPETEISQAEQVRTANEKLRAFVQAAAGKWCLVSETHGTTKKSRLAIRARLWGVFMRANGYEVTGFEMRTHYVEKVYKVYARYDPSLIVRSPQ